MLAKNFLLPSKICGNLECHHGKVREFMNDTSIQFLYGSLQSFITKSHNEDPVTIRAMI